MLMKRTNRQFWGSYDISSMFVFCIVPFFLVSCSKKSGEFTPPPPQVGVVTIATESLPVTTELPGRIDAVRTAEVRARVAGILLKEVYTEGSDVKAGDVLFQIDPAPLRASYDGA